MLPTVPSDVASIGCFCVVKQTPATWFGDIMDPATVIEWEVRASLGVARAIPTRS